MQYAVQHLAILKILRTFVVSWWWICCCGMEILKYLQIMLAGHDINKLLKVNYYDQERRKEKTQNLNPAELALSVVVRFQMQQDGRHYCLCPSCRGWPFAFHSKHRVHLALAPNATCRVIDIVCPSGFLCWPLWLPISRALKRFCTCAIPLRVIQALH